MDLYREKKIVIIFPILGIPTITTFLYNGDHWHLYRGHFHVHIYYLPSIVTWYRISLNYCKRKHFDLRCRLI